MAKCQALDAVADPVNVKAFTLVGGGEPEKLLCPVRALLSYRSHFGAKRAEGSKKVVPFL